VLESTPIQLTVSAEVASSSLGGKGGDRKFPQPIGEKLMNPAVAAFSVRRPEVLAILYGGFVCGVLDITAALLVYGSLGAKPLHLLQGIAGGLLGPRTFDGGLSTALLGLLCHFFIAFSAAAVYVTVSRSVPLLLNHAAISGALYGTAVYFFMNRIVVPLSAATKYPFSVKMMLIGVVIHIFCVGLPISIAAARYLRSR
jgi:hypothetical protein